MTKQYEVLQRASLFLEKHNREPKVAELLLQHHLQVSRAVFFTMMQEHVAEPVKAAFEEDIRKHAETGVPVQHLIGTAEFYGRSFLVNENVLIPRMETEELVEQVMNEVENMEGINEQQANGMKEPIRPLTIVDVGTGSGVIAITLKLELKTPTVIATDISAAALKTAKQNARQLSANVTILQGDFLKPFIQQNIKANVIVSNPPYIAKQEKTLLSDTVKDFDPEIALFADEHGLFAYRKIIDQSKSAIKENGLLLFEIGHAQGEAVRQIIKNVYPESTVKIMKDINGKDRIISAQLIAG